MQIVKPLTAPYSPRTLLYALALSLLGHFLLIYTIHLHRSVDVPPPIQVVLETSPTPQKIQIVSPSSVQSEQAPEHTNRLSEHNSIAPVEQLRRGEEPDKVSLPHKEQSPSHPTPARKPEKVSPTSQPTLRLRDSALVEKFGEESGATRQLEKHQAQTTPSDRERLQKLLEAQPFRPSQSSSLFSARAGNSDFLPDVRDGEVTLLNAKADRFAVFVRRVALQVFGNIRRDHWQELPRREIMSVQSFVTVEAVLSQAGKLLSTEIRESSGNASFDRLVRSAVTEGAWDKNPPTASIAADGNIHFIFKSRVWSSGFSGERQQERRWLLLSTGLL